MLVSMDGNGAVIKIGSGRDGSLAIAKTHLSMQFLSIATLTQCCAVALVFSWSFLLLPCPWAPLSYVLLAYLILVLVTLRLGLMDPTVSGQVVDAWRESI